MNNLRSLYSPLWRKVSSHIISLSVAMNFEIYSLRPVRHDTLSEHRLLPYLPYLPYLDIQLPSGHLCFTNFFKRGSRGGGGRGSGPPLRFVRGWVLCRGLMGRRGGVQRLCLPYYYHFFQARFARQYYTNILHIYILQSSMFSMARSPFSIFPLSNL